MTQSKSEWRCRLLALRGAIPERERRRASDAIVGRLRRLRCLREARTLLTYLAIGSEVRLDALIASGARSDVPILVPSALTNGAGRVWVAFSDQAEPDATRVGAAALTFPVAVFVPGVGFDGRGTRLGRGGGFYDRALAELRSAGSVTAIGLAYESQIVSALPRDAWDQVMDVVVSECRILRPRSTRGLLRVAT